MRAWRPCKCETRTISRASSSWPSSARTRQLERPIVRGMVQTLPDVVVQLRVGAHYIVAELEIVEAATVWSESRVQIRRHRDEAFLRQLVCDPFLPHVVPRRLLHDEDEARLAVAGRIRDPSL